MKSLILIFQLLVIVCLAADRAPAASASPEALREIDRLFSYGANQTGERQAVELIERALANEPADYQLLWRAARAYYYIGAGAAAQERLSWYERGIDAGRRATAQNPNSVEGHYWLGACYGGYCQEKGGLAALRAARKVRAEMEAALRLDAGYEDGSALMALGEIDRRLPRFFGGDLNRAVAYLERGLALAPRNPQMKCALAEAYLDAGRRDDARRQLEELLQLPVTTRINENRRAQERARGLLSRLVR